MCRRIGRAERQRREHIFLEPFNWSFLHELCESNGKPCRHHDLHPDGNERERLQQHRYCGGKRETAADNFRRQQCFYLPRHFNGPDGQRRCELCVGALKRPVLHELRFAHRISDNKHHLYRNGHRRERLLRYRECHRFHQCESHGQRFRKRYALRRRQHDADGDGRCELLLDTFHRTFLHELRESCGEAGDDNDLYHQRLLRCGLQCHDKLYCCGQSLAGSVCRCGHGYLPRQHDSLAGCRCRHLFLVAFDGPFLRELRIAECQPHNHDKLCGYRNERNRMREYRHGGGKHKSAADDFCRK
jgi:hypothetical protein